MNKENRKCSSCLNILSINLFCKDKSRKYGRSYVCNSCRSLWGKEYRQRLKIEVFEAYGGSVCNCCGEKEILFLSLDHVDNDGAEERRRYFGTNKGGSYHIYEKLRQNGYPNKHKYQVLCMNCQWGKKSNNGICPHKKI